MADIDFGNGPGTGDNLPMAFGKVEARLTAGEATAVILGRWFDIRQSGAIGDGTYDANRNPVSGSGTDNLPFLIAALAKAKAVGGGTIVIPRGVFRVAAPRWRIDFSGIEVHLAKGADLFFDTDDQELMGRLYFDGYSASGAQGYIYDVALTGLGRISARQGVIGDGRAVNDPGSADPWAAQSCLVTFRGCRRIDVRDVTAQFSSTWTFNFYDCQQYDVTGVKALDAVADGFHSQAGCEDGAFNHCYVARIGDDAYAVGFSTPSAVNRNISFNNCIAREVGACAYAFYAPSRNLSVNGSLVDTTWLSGLKIVPLTIANPNNGSGGYVIGASFVENVRIGSSTWTNIGFRDPAKRNQGDGKSFGISIEPESGRVSRVSIAAGQLFDNVRNLFVSKSSNGTTEDIVLAPGSVYTRLTAGGAGRATGTGYNFTPNGNSRTPDGTYTAVPEYVPGSATPPLAQTVLFSDDFNRADATTLGSSYVISNGTARVINGTAAFDQGTNFPNASVDRNVADVDVSIDIIAGARVRLYARQSSGVELAWDTAGNSYYYSGSTGTCYINNANLGAVSPAGKRLRLVVKGNVVTGYVDGTQLFSGQPQTAQGQVVTMGQGTLVGFGECENPNPGTARFDNFSVKTAP